jgi:hypothetical protein
VEICPARGLVEGNSLLTNDVDRKTVSCAVGKLAQSGLLPKTGEFQVALKEFLESKSQLHDGLRRAYQSLTKTRKFAKLCVAVNWAVAEVVGFKPDGGSAMEEHARTILKKLESKGASSKDGSLPVYLDKVLNAMINAGVELKQKEVLDAKSPPADAKVAEAKGGAGAADDVDDKQPRRTGKRHHKK